MYRRKEVKSFFLKDVEELTFLRGTLLKRCRNIISIDHTITFSLNKQTYEGRTSVL